MRYKRGSLILEAVDTFVRVTVEGYKTEVTKQEVPKPIEVAELVAKIRGFWPDKAVLQACARVADDARDNKEAKESIL